MPIVLSNNCCMCENKNIFLMPFVLSNNGCVCENSAFIATQAIDWLYCNCECDSRRSAVALLRGLANTGAIELVFDGNLVESEALPGTPGGDKSQRASLVNTVTRRRRRSALAASSDSGLVILSCFIL